MKPIIFTLGGCILYGMMNVIAEQKLRGFNIYAVYVYSYICMLTLSVILLYVSKIRGEEMCLPASLHDFGMTIAFAVVFFFANVFILKAYKDATVFTVTILMVTVPVFATAFRMAFPGGGLPNLNQIIGFVFAGLAVFFSIRGG